MKKFTVILAMALIAISAQAQAQDLSLKTVEVELPEQIELPDPGFPGPGFPGPLPETPASPISRVGEVLTIARDLVALGESVYTLIQRGKPSITTDFAAISVVPRDPISKEIIDPLTMDDCLVPTQKKFLTTITRGSKVVVSFEYIVIYTYGCSYDGKGKYIQFAMIQPGAVKAGYGWDVNANMKLQAIMNHGKKDDPIVGAMLTIKYSMKSWRVAEERNDTIHITGAGDIKTYSK